MMLHQYPFVLLMFGRHERIMKENTGDSCCTVCLLSRYPGGVCTRPVRSRDFIHSCSSRTRFTGLPVAARAPPKFLHAGGKRCFGLCPCLPTPWHQVCRYMGLVLCVFYFVTWGLMHKGVRRFHPKSWHTEKFRQVRHTKKIRCIKLYARMFLPTFQRT